MQKPSPSTLRATFLAALLLLLGGQWLIPGLALAQAAPAPDLGGSIVQLVLGFLVVIALLLGCLWVLKRVAAPQGSNSQVLKVIAGTAVGTRERVVVVEIGDKWLVLGVAPGQVTPLGEIPRQENIPPQRGQGGSGGLSSLGGLSGNINPADFAARLRKSLERNNAA